MLFLPKRLEKGHFYETLAGIGISALTQWTPCILARVQVEPVKIVP